MKVNLLLFSDLAGGTTPHREGDLCIEFHRCDPGEPPPLIEGAIWALVDWLLPGMSGLEVCRRLRCDPLTARAHITVILEDADAEARRRATWSGADDHLLGPIDRAQLVAKVIAQQQRADAAGHEQAIVRYKDLAVDLSAFQARWRGHPFPLMPIQLRLLRFLLERPGQIFTRAQLIEALGSSEAPLDERTVDVWVGRLRRALRAAGAGEPLRTVRSLGYVLDMNRPRTRSGRRTAA
jgi:two-component system phosphate regulon response regulator PhoB